MARINKPDTIKQMTGLGQLDPKSIAMAQGGDDIQAKIIPQQTQQEPMQAALKEGEIVFSIPAIIGAGEGDYDAGSEFILALHDKLRSLGEQLLQENSIAGVTNEQE